MRLINRSTYLTLAAAGSLVASLALIFGVGYYENAVLFVFQLAFCAGPIFIPFWVTARARSWRLGLTMVVVAVLAAGWGYTAYIDTRPYLGGGASFAILSGWLGSVVATIFAAIAVSVEPRPTN